MPWPLVHWRVRGVRRAIAINFFYCSADRPAAEGPPAKPRKNGTACDKPWYPLNPPKEYYDDDFP